ncbi:hypothetical protein RA2_01829 [Roseovarius sp. A-2]|nr:hypothetical protein RA2_01829 [Roseovarius sp. A-2]
MQKLPVGGTVGPVQFQTRVRTDLIFVIVSFRYCVINSGAGFGKLGKHVGRLQRRANDIIPYDRPLPISFLDSDTSQRSDNIPMNKCVLSIAKCDRLSEPSGAP